MFKKLSLVLLTILSFGFLLPCTAQNKTPKIVVGIVVDQMRYDYLYRFESKYGDNGFKRMLREGFSCENTQYDYAPTYTGPGHASIYTGTTPALHGIVGNNWYERKSNETVYVTEDNNQTSVGSKASSYGQQSPSRMLSSTITDELRLSNNYKSKVVGVCIKDRGGILPAGHIPNACFWFDPTYGRWITSTYYMKDSEFPTWVNAFNEQLHSSNFFTQTWDKISKKPYTESFADWNQYEGRLDGLEDNEGRFPYKLSPQMDSKKPYEQILPTPFGNDMTLNFALRTLDEMNMGKDEYTDFLCLSFSSPDYTGHLFGIHSEEVEDLYIRLDQNIATLLSELDKRYGKGNYLTFLTADHGGTETPEHLQANRIPAGVYNEGALKDRLNALFSADEKVVDKVINQQVYISDKILYKAGAARRIIEFLKQETGIYGAYTMEELMLLPDDFPYVSCIRKGIHPRRSGDIVFLLDPAWHQSEYFAHTGATHGSQYRYDTHVPLVWMGTGIPQGQSHARVHITDIAPTLAALLRIQEPNACVGEPIISLMK